MKFPTTVFFSLLPLLGLAFERPPLLLFRPLVGHRGSDGWARPLFGASFPEATCASDVQRVAISTTAGELDVSVDRALSPAGVDRFPHARGTTRRSAVTRRG